MNASEIIKSIEAEQLTVRSKRVTVSVFRYSRELF